MKKSNEFLEFVAFNKAQKKQNLLKQNSLLPCTRVVNGFRLVPRFVSDSDKRVIWCIHPNRSYRTFCFSSLLFATQFARKFVNRHTDKFWFRLWSPIYSAESAISNLKIF